MRRAVPSDARHVAAHARFDELPGSERRAAYADWVQPRLEQGTYVGWLATAGDEVIAGAGAVLLDWGPTRANPGGVMARINNVFTADEWRRKGIARSLLITVLRECEQLGIREFNLAATPAGRSLYGSLGFESYAAEMRRRVGQPPWL